jgi:hypothetical protein
MHSPAYRSFQDTQICPLHIPFNDASNLTSDYISSAYQTWSPNEQKKTHLHDIKKKKNK